MTTKLPVAILATLALTGAAAASASAAPTMSYNATTGGLYLGTTGNDVNTLTISPGGPYFKLVGPGSAGTGCTTTGADVACTLIRSAAGELHGYDGDDTLTTDFSYASGAVTLYGEDGNDTLRAVSGSPTRPYGGAGTDHIYSSSNTAFSYGGDGNDVQVTSSNGAGGTYGEGGNDILVAKSTALALDGGDGNDFLVFNSTNTPGGGGGAGTDTIVSGGSGGSFSGGTEDDILVFQPTGGAYCCGPTSATIHGNDGNDRLYAAPAKPTFAYGDAGDDRIDSYGNAQADTVDCGADTDAAYVDAIDTTANCETVTVGSAAPADAQVTAALSTASGYVSATWSSITPLP